MLLDVVDFGYFEIPITILGFVSSFVFLENVDRCVDKVQALSEAGQL